MGGSQPGGGLPQSVALSEDEHKLFAYIVEGMSAARIDGMTSGLLVSVLVRTCGDWLKAWGDCQPVLPGGEDRRAQPARGGWMVESPQSKHEREHRAEIGRLLKSLCLTPPALARVRFGVDETAQGDLFEKAVTRAIDARSRGVPLIALGVVECPELPPMLALTQDEQAIFFYVTAVLRDANIEHVHAGLAIAVLARIYCDWLAASAKCAIKGRVQASESGWEQSAPWHDHETKLKAALLEWTGKTCLTIPSLEAVRKLSGVKMDQSDPIADALVRQAIDSPTRQPLH